MPPTMFRTFRYTACWLTGRASLVTREIQLDRAGTPVPATLIMPAGAGRPLPTWIVLHGITRPGRAHPTLVRFTRALAASRCAVLVPEVPEWRELSLATHLTVPTIEAGLAALAALDEVAHLPVGLVGFSFGAPQAIAASADPAICDRIGGVVGFGGFCDLEHTLRFQFTGEHEWGRDRHHLRPDPYGRWIVGANYLTAIPGYEGRGAAADALRRLAAVAGDSGILSWDATFEEPKGELRRALPAEDREVFDLFAPASPAEPDRAAGEAMAVALADAGRRVEPAIEATRSFGDVRGPIHILHGRQDHLIPFSEAFRLRDALPPEAVAGATVTSLFGHSARDPFPGLVEGARETVSFFRALTGVLGVV
jgi:pimeloyl-ACP methyl ester carboxylesterase